jgi:hypothetical protein
VPGLALTSSNAFARGDSNFRVASLPRSGGWDRAQLQVMRT